MNSASFVQSGKEGSFNTHSMPKDAPLISFCSTCRDRLWQAEYTIPSNLAIAHSWDSVEFVLLDYGSTDGLAEWLATLDASLRRILRYYRTEAQEYNCPHAKNMAHRLSHGEILYNLDVDNFLHPAVFKELREVLCEPNVVLHAWSGKLFDGTFGRIATTRGDFYETRGYDESFEKMGYQDTDLLARLKRMGRKVCHSKLPSQAIPNDKPPGWGKMNKRNEAVAKSKSRKPINPDGFGRGTIVDEFGKIQYLS